MSGTSPDSISYPDQGYGVLAPIPAYVITVTDIPGVDPTGNDDSTIGLQMAADTLAAAGGGTLSFPPGTYRRTAPIVISSNTKVKGSGNARIIRAEGFSGDCVFVNQNWVTMGDYAGTTTPELQTDSDFLIEGLIFESITICLFLFARRITVRNCYGDFSNERPASFMQFRGCDDVLIEGNSSTFCSAGVDAWQGPTRFKIINNTFQVFENVTGLGNKYGIGVNALGPRNIPNVADDILIQGNSIEVNGSANGIQFDPLGSGCSARNVRVLDNRIVGKSGTNNYGIFGRGDIREVKIMGNHLEGINGPPLGSIHIGGFFGTLVTGVGGITTTSGSSQVVVAYPNNASAVGGWVRVNADPSGPTLAVGGVILDGYYLVTAVSPGAFTDPAATVTIESGQTAIASASGGGPIEVVGYLGNPVRGEISSNTLVNCANPAGALIIAQGTALTIADNDMTKCNPAQYQSLTFTDQVDRTTATQRWGSIIFGNSGEPGTGFPGASNSTRNAYVGRPLIIEARNNTNIPSWWIKGPVQFSDQITLPDESADWTPTLQFGGASTGIVYSTRVGKYTVIADMIYVECSIALSSKGSATGTAQIVGLPFPDATGTIPSRLMPTGLANMVGLTEEPVIRVSSQTIVLTTSIVGGVNLSDANFSNVTNLFFAGWYRID